MKFTETRLPGVYIVESTVFHDERGAFAPAWVGDEFKARGLATHVAQCSIAINRARGTVRGMHYQTAPFQEAKTIRVTKGSVFDVALDLRPESPAFRQWVGVELVAGDQRMLHIPVGFAHGYQTLADDTEVFYMVSASYSPPHQRGVRWNDPAFGIRWPLGEPTVINERDRTYPDFHFTTP